MKIFNPPSPKIIIATMSIMIFFQGLVFSQAKRITAPREAIDVSSIKGREIIIDIDVKNPTTCQELSKYFDIQASTVTKYNATKCKKSKTIEGEVSIHLPIDKLLPKPNVSKDKVVSPYCQLYYTVSKGETLFNIAAKFTHNDIKILQKLNSTTNSDIKVGQRLLIGYLNVYPQETAKTKVDPTDKTATKAIKPEIKPTNTTPQVQKKATSTIIKVKESAEKATKISSDITKESKKTLDNQSLKTTEKVVVGTEPKENQEENKIITKSVIGMWDKDGAETKNLFVLHNDAKIGSTVQIYFPMQKRKIKAKVLGRIPEGTYNNDINVLLSPSVAKELGILDTKANLVISYRD
jgi:LysM repeat protein